MINAQEQISEALTPNVQGSDTLLLEKKFEYNLEMHTKRLKNEIDALKQQQQILLSEIDSLRKQIQKLSLGSLAMERQQSSVSASGNSPALQQPGQQEHGSAANSTTQARPRYGDYKSEDVSIEKMFYFGGKR